MQFTIDLRYDIYKLKNPIIQFNLRRIDMSIFDIDWNGDGKVNFEDTAMDCIILSQLEENENESSPFSFFNDDDED